MNRCCATKLLFRQICLLDFTCVPEGAGILGEDAPGRSFYRNKVHQTQKATSEDVALIALAGSTGLEPATSDVTGRRSNQTELTPQAVVRVCFRSRALRGLVYTEVCPARNNFFEKIFRSLREGLRGWGRGLSLLLYSPAQDGKHIKCFPLRAELATNLTPAPSPGDPPCRHFVRVVVVPRRFAARRPRSPRRGLSKDLAEALPLAQMETGDASASPVFVAVSPSQ